MFRSIIGLKNLGSRYWKAEQAQHSALHYGTSCRNVKSPESKVLQVNVSVLELVLVLEILFLACFRVFFVYQV